MVDGSTKDFDMFFYYGQNELEKETQHDLMCNLLQPKRSLFYDRFLDAAGIPDYENMPEGLSIRINLPYDIVNSFSKRNQYVSNGSDGYPDRRVAVSQSTIRVNFNSANGQVDITVLFIPLADLKQSEINFNLGTNS